MKRFVIRSATINGLITGSALPPLYNIPFLFLGLWNVLSRLQKLQTPQEGFAFGLAFGWGYHLITLYWVALALHVDWPSLWPLFVPVLLGFPFILSIFMGIGMALLVACAPSKVRLWWLPVMWIVIEWTQGVLYAFPWNPLGMSYCLSKQAIQMVSVMGISGMSFLLMLTVVMSFYMIKNFSWKRLFLTLILALGPFLWGRHRLQTTTVTLHPDIYLALIQPNMLQTLKYDRPEQEFSQLLHQTAQAAKKTHQPTLIVWPESAVAYDLTQDHTRKKQVLDILKPQDLLCAGMIRKESLHNTFYNSLVFFGPGQHTMKAIDKAQLVPFGEYFPLRALLSSFFPYFQDGIDLTPGTPCMHRLDPPFSFNVGALICYDVLFPPVFRPNIWINPTNDGWYLHSSGPYQHYEHSRLRAIETGVPLVRVATTGISAVFDPLGQELKPAMAYNEKAIQITSLPYSLAPTLFFQYHPWILLFCVGLYSGVLFWFQRRRHRFFERQAL